MYPTTGQEPRWEEIVGLPIQYLRIVPLHRLPTMVQRNSLDILPLLLPRDITLSMIVGQQMKSNSLR